MNIHSVVARSKTTPRTADKREAILDAALELFAERGFHGTAVPQVAENASVGAGTIYRYFDSKEGLVNALYQKHKHAIADRVLRDFPMSAAPRDQFCAFWGRMFDYAVEHPLAIKFLELHHHASYLDAESLAVEQRMMDFAEAFLRQNQAGHAVKAVEPALLMGIVTGAFVGVLRKHWEGALALTPEIITAAEQCCWEAIRI